MSKIIIMMFDANHKPVKNSKLATEIIEQRVDAQGNLEHETRYFKGSS